MRVADTLRLTGGCKIQPNNLKSIGTPIKFQTPKSLSFGISKPSSGPRNFGCSSRFSSSKKFVSPENMYFIPLTLELEQVTPQFLSLTFDFLDDDGQLRQKFDEVVSKGSAEFDIKKKANNVLDEVVPFLLENADRWISGEFAVSSNLDGSMHKIDLEEILTDLCIQSNEPNCIHCTRVFVDVSIVGVIDDDKFKDVRTREDLKGLLHHLISMEGVTSAFALSLVAKVSKEKTKAFGEHSHSTT